MNAVVIGLITFGCSYGAAIVGLTLHSRVPERHLDSDSKDVVKLVLGLIATLSALVLGLLIASAQSSYSTQSGNVQKLAVSVAVLDRVLELYGPEANDTRELLGQAVAAAHDQIWTADRVEAVNIDPSKTRYEANRFASALEGLAPKSDAQRHLQAQALQLSQTIGETRSLMFGQAGSSVSWPFLVVVIFWVSVLFLGFGLFARFHATVAIALMIGSASVAAAIFLILELSRPYTGLIQLSDEPLRKVLVQIGRAPPSP
jgi:hypothetical protein